MRWAELSDADVLFTHFDEDKDKQTTYVVSRMFDWCLRTGARLYLVPITQEDAAHIREKRGLEEHRLERLRTIPPGRWEAVLLCHHTDDSYLLVDGSHRYVISAELGRLQIKAYLLEPHEWQPFVVEDAPPLDVEHTLRLKSGL